MCFEFEKFCNFTAILKTALERIRGPGGSLDEKSEVKKPVAQSLYESIGMGDNEKLGSVKPL
jgi:hypothetical protein